MSNSKECTNEDCLVCNLVELFNELHMTNSLEEALRYVIEMALSNDEDDELEEVFGEIYSDGYQDGFLDGISESKKQLDIYFESTVRAMLNN